MVSRLRGMGHGVRSQRSEVRNQRTDGRGQTTEAKISFFAFCNSQFEIPYPKLVFTLCSMLHANADNGRSELTSRTANRGLNLKPVFFYLGLKGWT